MFFSGLLSSEDRPVSSKPSLSMGLAESRPEFIYDEAQLPCLPPERPNLHELNNSLEALAAVFPDIQIEVFRELLAKFDGESRLALVAEALLKNQMGWAKGRWRTVAEKPADRLTRADLFCSHEYIKAVSALARQEFRGLSRSTINAVLAESNYAYLNARRTLVALSAKSWRFTISSLFLRRKPVVADGDADEHHPLVVWRSTGYGAIIPAIRTTGSAELDRELYDVLIRPLKEQERCKRDATDHELAMRLNSVDAELNEAIHECSSCFSTVTFEELTSCSGNGHLICFRCVQHATKEALFGQAWLSSINPDTGTLKCLAVDGDGCSGHVPSDHLQRALLEDEATGADMVIKLVYCPFCSYAEIDDMSAPAGNAVPRRRVSSTSGLVLVALAAAMIVLSLPVALLWSVACFLLSSGQPAWRYVKSEWQGALHRRWRRRRGLRFTCQNPRCERASCLSCHKGWTDIHVCHESSLVALRTQVEQAMSMAIKRVCPRCNTSFVKNAGCNKLTCPCGYKMCYVCRANLADEGYRHFCDHFRPDGDPRPCRECNRCNLWETEDIERVLQEARKEAERRWKERERRELSGVEKVFLDSGVAAGSGCSIESRRRTGGWPMTLADALDMAVDVLYA